MKLYLKEDDKIIASIVIKRYNNFIIDDKNLLICETDKNFKKMFDYEKSCDISIVEKDKILFSQDNVLFTKIEEKNIIFNLGE